MCSLTARIVERFQFYMFIVFIHKWIKPYLPLPSQPKLVLIYRPWRDARLSWPRQHHVEYPVCPKQRCDFVTVFTCSSRHASLGSWSTGESRTHPRSLGPQATTLTTESPHNYALDQSPNPPTSRGRKTLPYEDKQ